jgi:hypothetical protein
LDHDDHDDRDCRKLRKHPRLKSSPKSVKARKSLLFDAEILLKVDESLLTTRGLWTKTTTVTLAVTA